MNESADRKENNADEQTFINKLDNMSSIERLCFFSVLHTSINKINFRKKEILPKCILKYKELYPLI